MSETKRQVEFRAVISVVIVVGFFAAYFMEPGNETMEGALIAAFAGAWGYWLGSSKGAHDTREIMGRAFERRVTDPKQEQPNGKP